MSNNWKKLCLYSELKSSSLKFCPQLHPHEHICNFGTNCKYRWYQSHLSAALGIYQKNEGKVAGWSDNSWFTHVCYHWSPAEISLNFVLLNEVILALSWKQSSSCFKVSSTLYYKMMFKSVIVSETAKCTLFFCGIVKKLFIENSWKCLFGNLLLLTSSSL